MQFPIVGAHFHPPAKSVLQCLPSGAFLWLEREPENPHDDNAIKVCCSPEAVPESQHPPLLALISGHGMDMEEFLSLPEIHLGYIPRTEAVALAAYWDANHRGQTCEGKLVFDMKGKPQVQWDWPQDVEQEA